MNEIKCFIIWNVIYYYKSANKHWSFSLLSTDQGMRRTHLSNECSCATKVSFKNTEDLYVCNGKDYAISVCKIQGPVS